MVSNQQKLLRGQTALRAKACKWALAVQDLRFAVSPGLGFSHSLSGSAAWECLEKCSTQVYVLPLQPFAWARLPRYRSVRQAAVTFGSKRARAARRPQAGLP